MFSLLMDYKICLSTFCCTKTVFLLRFLLFKHIKPQPTNTRRNICSKEEKGAMSKNKKNDKMYLLQTGNLKTAHFGILCDKQTQSRP